jgi:pyruvate, orthophosphate dikinase
MKRVDPLSLEQVLFPRLDPKAKREPRCPPIHERSQILQDNPFEVLDVKGVGKLMQLAVEWGRKERPDLHVGICGEHGGHPKSISFCDEAGLDYVSCSGPRVPVARLAAAQAAMAHRPQ